MLLVARRIELPDGHEFDWPTAAFSPRGQNLNTIRLHGTNRQKMLDKLGKHPTSVSCLYIKRLFDVDTIVLRK